MFAVFSFFDSYRLYRQFFFPSERTDAASRTPKRGIEPQATLEPTQRVCDFAIVAVDALEPTRFG